MRAESREPKAESGELHLRHELRGEMHLNRGVMGKQSSYFLKILWVRDSITVEIDQHFPICNVYIFLKHVYIL